MNNTDINTIKEFRRFVNTIIYPETIGILIDKIRTKCNTYEISYISTPQALIKFRTNVPTTSINELLQDAFVEHFSDPLVASLVRSRIHTDINDEELKNILRSATQEIQFRNPCFMGLLYNFTTLNNNYIYLYL